MATDRPECTSWPEDVECLNPSDHEGFKHADSWEEVRTALNAKQTVVDVEGDRVTGFGRKRLSGARVQPYDQDVDRLAIYYIREPNSEDDYIQDYQYILVPEFKPVTKEELSEVYRSLGVTTESPREA